jgi:hypothetical protein
MPEGSELEKDSGFRPEAPEKDRTQSPQDFDSERVLAAVG